MADKEKLKELLDQNYKHAEIAKILGITRARVTSLANKMGYKSNRAIDVNKPGGHIIGSKSPLLNDRNKLYDLYVTQMYSLSYIAELADVGLGTVVHHLRRHKIPARTKDEYVPV